MKIERQLTLYKLSRLNINLLCVMYVLLGALSIAFSTVNPKDTHKFIQMGTLLCMVGLVTDRLLKPPHGR
jgi:hypothetical protein